MHSKHKSVPDSFLRSRFSKNRSTAFKEIEAWIQDDNKRRGGLPEAASRMSGQLIDNVTEERMLKARLWELSKERYKFLINNDYKKQLFTDRIQRKSGARLRRVSTSNDHDMVATSRKPSLNSLMRQRDHQAPLALLNRIIYAQNKKRTASECQGAVRPVPVGSPAGRISTDADIPKSMQTSNESPNGLPRPFMSALKLHTVSFVPIGKLDVLNGRRFCGQTSADTKSTLDGQSLQPNSTLEALPVHELFSKRLPKDSAISITPISAASPPPAATNRASTASASNETAPVAVDWHGRTGAHRHRRCAAVGRLTDFRYTRLESSLAPLYQPRKPAEVKSIVQKFDALHVAPKRPTVAKRKTALKALEYIMEKGFPLYESL